MFGHKNNRNGEKSFFAIRLESTIFGAASVAIAALFVFANGVARADSLSVSPDTAATEKTLNDEGRSRLRKNPCQIVKSLLKGIWKKKLQKLLINQPFFK